MAVRQAVDVEINSNCIERLHHYAKNLEMEIDNQKPRPEDWPNKGIVEFRNLVIKYSDGGEAVLKNITFTIGSKEKIGIVGRTVINSFLIIGCWKVDYHSSSVSHD